MGVEQLTYIEIATRLNVSREAARPSGGGGGWSGVS